MTVKFSRKDGVACPGRSFRYHLEENNGAVAINLTVDDLREIDSAFAKIKVQGARYPEKLEQMSGR